MDGVPVVASPRQILRRQVARLAERGWTALAGTELEFIVFEDTYEQAWESRLSGPHAGEPVQRRLLAPRHRAASSRCSADPPRCATPACGRVGEGRVQLRPARDRLPVHRLVEKARRALACSRSARRRSRPRRAAASPSWRSTTQREGNSCHIHLSLRDEDDHPVFAGERSARLLEVFEHFLAGLLARSRELDAVRRAEHQQLQALRRRILRADRAAWGHDNRTCAFRVVGHHPAVAARRVPGPRRRRQSLPRHRGAGRRRPARRRPRARARAGVRAATPTTRTRRACRRRSGRRPNCSDRAPSRATAFGDEVVDHYVQHGPRRARRLRVGGDRLGALPGVRAPMSSDRCSPQPRDRARRSRRSATLGLEETDEAIARSVAALPAWRAIVTGRSCPAAAPLRRGRRRSQRGAGATRGGRTPVIRSRTPAGRRATSATSWPTTRAHPRGSSVARSRSRGASTSPSASRSAWSGSSCRGTSRCRSPRGASRRHWRPATPSCSSRPT